MISLIFHCPCPMNMFHRSILRRREKRPENEVGKTGAGAEAGMIGNGSDGAGMIGEGREGARYYDIICFLILQKEEWWLSISQKTDKTEWVSSALLPRDQSQSGKNIILDSGKYCSTNVLSGCRQHIFQSTLLLLFCLADPTKSGAALQTAL